jgi:hypothetical protein
VGAKDQSKNCGRAGFSSIGPLNLHERRDGHSLARNSEFALQSYAWRKWPIGEYANSGSPGVLCHGLQRDERFP